MAVITNKSPVDQKLRDIYSANREALDPLMQAISAATDPQTRTKAMVTLSMACGRIVYDAGATDVILAVKNAVNSIKLPITGE